MIHVDVPSGGVDGTVVDHTITVVILPVAELGGAWEGVRIDVVAFFASGETIGIRVCEASGTVAVVVVRVGAVGLIGTRVEPGVRIVTITAVLNVACGLIAGDHGFGIAAVVVMIAVEVPSGHVDCIVLIRGTVTIVVHTVAVLGSTRIGAGIDVIAVGGVSHVTARHVAGDDGVGAVAKAIMIHVDVPGGGVDSITAINGTVAVVIQTVADLVGVGVDRRVEIVTVSGIGHIARGGRTVPNLRQRIPEGIPVVVQIPVGHVIGIHVRVAVAIVIKAIADLGGVGVDTRIGVITVTVHNRVARGHFAGRGGDVGTEAVAVRVLVPGGDIGSVVVDHVVAVVVETITNFLVAREDVGLGIVAVGGVGDVVHRGLTGLDGLVHVAEVVAVRVLVERGSDVFVGDIVAVVVDRVANFGRTWIDVRIAVVAVGGVDHVVGRSLDADERDTRVTVTIAVAVEIPGGGLETGIIRTSVIDAGVLGIVFRITYVTNTVIILVGLIGIGLLGTVVGVVRDAVPILVGPTARSKDHETREKETAHLAPPWGLQAQKPCLSWVGIPSF